MLEIKVDRKEGPLVVLFGSQHRPERERKVWEWERSTEGNRIFFTDTECLWYQNYIEEIVDFLGPLNPSELRGCSRGGYAALLIGHLLGVKSVTYSPQTILEDERWPDIKKAREISKYPDLSFIEGDHDIYYCRLKASDVFHAERMKVNLYPIDCDVHNVAKVLKCEHS